MDRAVALPPPEARLDAEAGGMQSELKREEEQHRSSASEPAPVPPPGVNGIMRGHPTSREVEDAGMAAAAQYVMAMHSSNGLSNGSAPAPAAPGSNGNGHPTSRYIGVAWDASAGTWRAEIHRKPSAKHAQQLGLYASEEDAARAYDTAAGRLYGVVAQRNFPPSEVATEAWSSGAGPSAQPAGEAGGALLALTRGKTSAHIGVGWSKLKGGWLVQVRDPATKRQKCIGTYGEEEDAARAYDFAAMEMLGLDCKRNFPDVVITEAPMTQGEKRKEGHSSQYRGVTWHKINAGWLVYVRNPETKRQKCVGAYACEEEAARAYDYAAVRMLGADCKRNFPGEVIDEAPVSLGTQRKDRKTSRFYGVNWDKSLSGWKVHLYDPKTKRQRHVGCYQDEDAAAKAYDHAAVVLLGPDCKRNYADEIITEPPSQLKKRRVGRPPNA